MINIKTVTVSFSQINELQMLKVWEIPTFESQFLQLTVHLSNSTK